MKEIDENNKADSESPYWSRGLCTGHHNDNSYTNFKSVEVDEVAGEDISDEGAGGI